MDRTLNLIQDGCLLAEIIFAYQTPTTGIVKISVNKIIDAGLDIKTTMPLSLRSFAITYPLLGSINKAKEFDRNFVAQQPEFEGGISDAVEYVYPKTIRRYVVGNINLGAIANIHANFVTNSKQLTLVSGKSISRDTIVKSKNNELNVDLIRRVFGEGNVNIELVDPDYLK
jgi:hypothetical protein